jgi:hypothetical protein
MRRLTPLLVLAFIAALPLSASAQWQWLDAAGKKVYSDQAPPQSVPEKDILARPGPPSRTAAAAPSPDAAASLPQAGASGGASRPSGVDKDLESKARKAEEAEKARLAADAEKAAKARADNCTRARQGKATLDSGIRIARLNAKGEREIMDDRARSTEESRLKSLIGSECK